MSDPCHLKGATMGDLGVFLVTEILYLVYMSVPNRLTVSATLERSYVYMVVLTVTEVLLLVLCMAYFQVHRAVHPTSANVGITMASTGILCWYGLVLVPYTTNTIVHVVMAGGFVLSTMGYGWALIWITKGVGTSATSRIILYSLFWCATILTFTYLALWCTGSDSTWVVEHSSLIFTHISLLIYFTQYSFTKATDKAVESRVLFNGFKIQLSPGAVGAQR